MIFARPGAIFLALAIAGSCVLAAVAVVGGPTSTSRDRAGSAANQLAPSSPGASLRPSGGGPPGGPKGLAKTPVVFEANAGQAAAGVSFLTRGSGYALMLAPDKMTFVLPSGRDAARRQAALRFQGANPAPAMAGLGRLGTKINYLQGNDSRKWLQGLPGFAGVVYRQLYPGIDLMFYSNRQGEVEYDFVVAPGADPAKIALRLDGPGKISIDEDGDAVVSTEAGAVRQKAPTVYQRVGGRKRAVRGAYELTGNTLGFRLGAYDGRRPLVIDPVVSWATYLPGSATQRRPLADPSKQVHQSECPHDDGSSLGAGLCGHHHSVAVDRETGESYVAGPVVKQHGVDLCPDGAENIFGGPTMAQDALVAKFDAKGSELYRTYVGGCGEEIPNGVAVAAGSAYVTGSTDSGNFPGCANCSPGSARPEQGPELCPDTPAGGAGAGPVEGCPFQPANGSSMDAMDAENNANTHVRPGLDAFVMKLNASGDLEYSSYLGGGNWEGGKSIAVDALGRAYVVGTFRSFRSFGDKPTKHFPTTPNAYQRNVPYGTEQSEDDLVLGRGWNLTYSQFLSVFSPTGQQLVYSTFFHPKENGNGQLTAWGVAVGADSPGGSPFAYLTGTAPGRLLPTKGSPYQDARSANAVGNVQSAYLAKFDPGQSGEESLIYSTFLGSTKSTEDVEHPELFDHSPQTWGLGVAADRNGNVYVAGATQAGDFPSTDEGQDPANTNCQGRTDQPNPQPNQNKQDVSGCHWDGFVVKLRPSEDGSKLYYGKRLATPGKNLVNDLIWDIDLDAAGNVYVTGDTGSPGFPSKDSPRPFGGATDAFVAKLAPDGSGPVYSAFLGGAGHDRGRGIAVDNDGNVYLAGSTDQGSGGSFPKTIGPPYQAAPPPTETKANTFLAKVGVPRPTVTRIDPSRGPVTGGTQMTIHGTSLGTAKSVSVGVATITAEAIKVKTEDKLVVVMPPAEPGTVDVAVTTAGGVSEVTADTRFTYFPVITQLVPDSGPTEGGTDVGVIGHGLAAASQVRFGGAPVSFKPGSATRLSATSPANPVPQKVPVALTVTVPATGEKVDTPSGVFFTYVTAGLPPGSAGSGDPGGVQAGSAQTSNGGTTSQTGGGPILPSGPGSPAQTAPVPVSQAAPGQAVGPSTAVQSLSTASQSQTAGNAAAEGAGTVNPGAAAPAAAQEENLKGATRYAMVARDSQSPALPMASAGLLIVFAAGLCMRRTGRNPDRISQNREVRPAASAAY